MSAASDRLYDLLPVLYRLRDADRGQALRALMAIIDDTFSQVEADITGLYDNWFIETSDEWVVPYIGDLLGVRGLNTLPTSAFSQRAYVANTLFYRRRKGTAYVLGILAGDVTGWPAHVVEFFELLQTTQYMNHIRLFNTRPDLRDVNRLNLLDTPFDSLAHTADMRHINDRRGKHNIPNLGVCLWRLQNYPLASVTPRRAQAPHAYGYHFSTLGNPAPLFNTPGGVGFPDEQKVPAPIRPYDFYQDLETYQQTYASASNPPADSRYYGLERSLFIVKDGTPVAPMDVMCKDLRSWDRPPAGKVAVDVLLGRITFAAGEEPAHELTVSYNYGFSADLGGGPYDRRERLAAIHPPVKPYYVGAADTYHTLADALSAWITDHRPPAVFRIRDSRTYDAALTIDLPAKGMLVIECENEQRPTLVNANPLTVTSEALVSEDTAAFTLGGLLVEGWLATSGKLNLTLADCTLVPGRLLDEDGYPVHPDGASLVVDPGDAIDTSVAISRSILGPLELPEDCRGLTVSDSLIDAPSGEGRGRPGPGGARRLGGRDKPRTGQHAAARHRLRSGARQGAEPGLGGHIHRSRHRRPAPGGLRALQLRPGRLVDPAPLPLPAGPGRRRPQAAARPGAPARSRGGRHPAADRAAVHPPGIRCPGLRPTGGGLRRRDQDRCRERLRDGRLQPARTAPAPEEPAGGSGRVPAFRPGGRHLLCDVTCHCEGRAQRGPKQSHGILNATVGRRARLLRSLPVARNDNCYFYGGQP